MMFSHPLPKFAANTEAVCKLYYRNFDRIIICVSATSQFNFALLCTTPKMVNVVFDIQLYHVPQWGLYILFFAKRTTKDTGNDNYDVLIVSIVQSYFIIR